VDEARLEDLARQAAERVRRSGEPEILESMTSKERWVVHNFLKEVEGVASVSEGEGASKRVKIVPV
jgi:predicted RNA-binding protein Jag